MESCRDWSERHRCAPRHVLKSTGHAGHPFPMARTRDAKVIGILGNLGLSGRRMSLMGKAAMVAWHDLAPGTEADHDDWHSHEHLFERLGIPGFRRGRRCRALAASAGLTEEYFLMYEVDDLSVLTSEAYLARLNDPTPWSRRIIPTIRNMTRTLCRVRASVGGGMGTNVLTLRISPSTDVKASALDWIEGELLPGLPRLKGIVGAHLLEGDAAASGQTTDEAKLRGGGDRIADLVLLVEDYDSAAVCALSENQFSREELKRRGIASDSRCGVYQVAHSVTRADLS